MRFLVASFLLFATSPAMAANSLELLNEEERRWLTDRQGPLLVGTEANYHPYNFVDKNGELSGVSGDYMRLLQQRLGLEFEVRAYETFAEVLQAAEKRQIDIVPLILAAPERKSYLDFTQPAYETRDHIFVRQETQQTLGLDDLQGMRVGVVAGYGLVEVLKRDYPDLELVLVPTEPQGLLDLSLGRIDAFITELGTSSYYIQRNAITNLRVAGVLDIVDAQTFGTRDDWPILNSIIGKGLASISTEERAEIQHRWIRLRGVGPREIQLLWSRVAAGVAVVLLLLVGVFVWSLSLRRLVAKRTLEVQRELAERRLVEADKLRLAVAVEQSAEFVLVVDTSAKVEFANRAFRAAYGADELENLSFDELAARNSTIRPSEALRVAHEKGNWRGQLIIGREQDRVLKVKMNIAPIFDQELRIDGYVATGRDVTNEEQLESRIRQGERLSALGTLAGGIAHDFNNLLVPILGYTELVRSEGPEDLVPFLDGIAEASERARDLVQRIMSFGRGGTGEMEALDIRHEIDDAISFLRSLLPKTVTLVCELSECGAVRGDSTQIQQILLNLCGNASDAMAGTGGTLTIKLGESVIANEDALPDINPGDYAVLTVSDTGIGMTEERRAKIFDPYFSAKQHSGGTGLGLAIVHGAVARHGGYIHVRSTVDVGTTFQIFLPLVDAEPLPHSDMSRCNVSRGSGERILLVDDDKLVLATVKEMLQGLGYRVDDHSDPRDALRALASKPTAYDAILTDLSMPSLTGIQLAAQAEKIRPSIPVAVMTGNTAALADYDKRYIAKPMRLVELSECLNEMLSSTRAVSAS